MHGKHWLKSSATTQKGVSLSTGESEFHAIVKSVSMAMGMRTLMRDWNMEKPIEVLVDATAGMGIASRRGVGRVRHLHAPLLWVQQVVEKRVVSLKKVKGVDNVADLPTKHVDSVTMWSHLDRMGFQKMDGSSRLALKAAV